MRIEIIQNEDIPDGCYTFEAPPPKPLQRHRYEFWVIDGRGGDLLKIVLNKYFYETRESSRKRKWKKKKIYTRISSESRHMFGVIPFEEVPLPELIEHRVKLELKRHIDKLSIEERY